MAVVDYLIENSVRRYVFVNYSQNYCPEKFSFIIQTGKKTVRNTTNMCYEKTLKNVCSNQIIFACQKRCVDNYQVR
jgi:hypothetical protein